MDKTVLRLPDPLSGHYPWTTLGQFRPQTPTFDPQQKLSNRALISNDFPVILTPTFKDCSTAADTEVLNAP